MAYVEPTDRDTGYVVPAAVWNQDVVDNVIALKALIDALPSTTDNSICEGRLTLTTGVPVTTGDVTAATTVYWAPYKGNRIALYSGSAWVLFSQAQLSIAVPATTSQMYDVFVDYNSGTPALSVTAWTNDTTRATALTTQDGVYVLTGSTGKRYVGSFRTTGVSGQTEDSVTKRYLWNYYNRVSREMRVLEATNNWTYSAASWQQANAAATNQLDIVVGVSEDAIDIRVVATASNGANGGGAAVGIGEDSVTVAVTGMLKQIAFWNGSTAGNYVSILSTYTGTPAIGRHYYAWLERGNATGTTTWYGDTPADVVQSGISALWES